MQMPGEALLLKMWETLIEKGIGGLISPYYTVWKNKKLTLGAIELDKISKIAIANGEEEIVELDNSQLLITNQLESINKQNNFPMGTVQEYVRKNEVRRLIQEELNVTQAIIHANNRLLNDETPLPENVINIDWLHMWRDNASKVSDEEVQSLWGNVLAQEFIEPGRYSLRLLEFIKTLSKSEALVIEKIAPYTSKLGVVFGRVNNEEFLTDDRVFLEKTNLSRTELKLLEEIGVLSDLSGLGMVNEFENMKKKDEAGFLSGFLINDDTALMLSSESINESLNDKLSIAYYSITKIGREVLSLINYETEPHHLEWLAHQFSKDYKVTICDYSNEVLEPQHIFDV